MTQLNIFTMDSLRFRSIVALHKYHKPFGLGAKSQTLRIHCAPRGKFITTLTPMAWIYCGLDSLWFGSIVVGLKSHEPLATGPSRKQCVVAALLLLV